MTIACKWAIMGPMVNGRLSSEKVLLVAGNRQWISACITRPDRLAAQLGVVLAHDWDGDFYSVGAPYVAQVMREGSEGWWYWWVVERPRDGRSRAALVGFAGFKGPPTSAGNVEVLYNIAPSVQRCGLGTQSTRLLLTWVFGNTDVRRVVATIDPANLASRRVVEKCGFSMLENECDEDEVVYAITPDAHAHRKTRKDIAKAATR